MRAERCARRVWGGRGNGAVGLQRQAQALWSCLIVPGRTEVGLELVQTESQGVQEANSEPG